MIGIFEAVRVSTHANFAATLFAWVETHATITHRQTRDALDHHYIRYRGYQVVYHVESDDCPAILLDICTISWSVSLDAGRPGKAVLPMQQAPGMIRGLVRLHSMSADRSVCTTGRKQTGMSARQAITYRRGRRGCPWRWPSAFRR